MWTQCNGLVKVLHCSCRVSEVLDVINRADELPQYYQRPLQIAGAEAITFDKVSLSGFLRQCHCLEFPVASRKLIKKARCRRSEDSSAKAAQCYEPTC